MQEMRNIVFEEYKKLGAKWTNLCSTKKSMEKREVKQ